MAITNNKPLYTVTQYGLKVTSPGITSVQAVNQAGQPLPAEVVTTNNQTSIGITFPDQLVGEGKVRNFTISYLDPNAAVVSGQVLEVTVPPVAKDTYDPYQIKLETPLKFGLPSLSYPTQPQSRIEGQRVITEFSQLNNTGAVVIFGSTQIFELTLRYQLANPTNQPGIIQIAIPPDTSFQKMYYYHFQPWPDQITTDLDGNWIATYQLAANTQVTAEVAGQARLFLTPQADFPIFPPQPAHVSAQEYWETQTPPVETIAASLTDVRSIYNYVVEHLTYNYQRTDQDLVRLGAAQALTTPDQALCQEFTDSFVALARAKKLASRRVTGYAYTQNQALKPLSLVADVLHSWPEYYDQVKQIWVAIDPTWGYTSGGLNYFDYFDLNHVVFAINGLSSSKPFPAGSYKTTDDNQKQVEVRFGQSQMSASPELSGQIAAIKPELGGWWGQPILELKNQTGQAFYHLPVKINVDDPQAWLETPAIIEIDRVLPYQFIRQPIRLRLKSGWQPQPVAITLDYGQQPLHLTVIAFPPVWYYFGRPFIWAGLGIGSLGLAILAGRLLVPRRRRSGAVRR